MGDDDKKKSKEKRGKKKKIDDEVYEEELLRLQGELCKLQKWVVHKGLKVVVISYFYPWQETLLLSMQRVA